MLQTKIFLSNGSDVCSLEDQFNAWVAENPNVAIKDVKFQHAMTGNYDVVESVIETSSIMILFETPEGSEPYSRFKWNPIWNRISYFADKIGNKGFVADELKNLPNFPLVGTIPKNIIPILVKREDGSYCISQISFTEDFGYSFVGVNDEHFSWQYLPR